MIYARIYVWSYAAKQTTPTDKGQQQAHSVRCKRHASNPKQPANDSKGEA